MRRVSAALAAIEGVAVAVATVFLLVIMLLVVTDVFLRYVVGRPLSFTYDLVGVYLMTGVFFLTLSHAQGSRVHVAVDILVSKLSARRRAASDLVTCLTGGTIFALLTVAGFDRARDNYVSQDVLAGIIPWPTWIATAMVPLGAGLLVLRFAATATGHLLALATGRPPIGLPPRHEAGAAEHFE